MKNITVLMLTIISGLMVLYSCSTTPVCIAPSTTPLNNKVIQTNYGEVEGSQTSFSLFSLWMLKPLNLDTAIRNALNQKGGDALINVRCYDTTKYFILFSLDTITVKGEAIKFEEEKEEKKKDEKK